MEERFAQQLKKGILEMLVLELICQTPTYGYELLSQLKERSAGQFQLREGTLYPILYRLEDEGLIAASWQQGAGRVTPKKIYAPTALGRETNYRRQETWKRFVQTVDGFLPGGVSDE